VQPFLKPESRFSDSRRVRRALHYSAALVVIGLSMLAFGCGQKEGDQATSSHVARVTLRDFHIKAPKRIPAGDVTFSIWNKGPNDHELLVVREDESQGRGDEEGEEDETPLRRDGLTVDEDKLGSSLVDALEPEEPGVHTLRVNLKPGRYEMLCNMAGHYFAGMEAGFEVQ
jgi:uncharacterized cupredoxin-like copper-binding protein